MIRYYLFGLEAINIYMAKGANKMLNSNHSYDLVKFNEQEKDISWLLAMYTGWGNYLELKEEEYLHLKNYQNG